MRSDAVVLGGGVVGLAVAMRLAVAGRSVVLLERHRSFGQETSSRNSEVIHAGMYYATGSLKAELCVAGNRSLRAWCDTHNVPSAQIGKFIVATAEDEVPTLAAILERGAANGVPPTACRAFAGLLRASSRPRCHPCALPPGSSHPA